MTLVRDKISDKTPITKIHVIWNPESKSWDVGMYRKKGFHSFNEKFLSDALKATEEYMENEEAWPEYESNL